jgi:chemotaxis protein CheC
MRSLLDIPSNGIIDENIPGIYEPQYVYRENTISEVMLDDRDMAIWKILVDKGMQNAFHGLSELLNHTITLDTLQIEQMPVNDVLLLSGTPDSNGVGVYMSIDDYIDAQLLLTYTPEVAYRFIDIMLKLPPGTTNVLGDIEWHALKDIGNITGSYFLNTLADNTGLMFLPSPPEVVVDSIYSIMRIPMTSITMSNKDALLVKASFSSENQELRGTFLALPTTDVIKAVTKRIDFN